MIPLLYRKGHLPYGTQPGPVASYSDPFVPEVAEEGQGTVYPVTMTLEEFCACFYRVKKWKLSGTVTVESGDPEGDGLWEGTENFELIFTRNVASEEKIFTLGNSRAGELFASPEESQEFSGTFTYHPPEQDQNTLTATFTITADFSPTSQQETVNAAVGVSGEDATKLAVAVRLRISVDATASGEDDFGPVSFSASFGAFSNGGAAMNPMEPVTGTAAATLQIDGPFAAPLSVELYEESSLESPTGAVSFTSLQLEPHEWFAYEVRGAGPTYDTETGAFL